MIRGQLTQSIWNAAHGSCNSNRVLVNSCVGLALIFREYGDYNKMYAYEYDQVILGQRRDDQTATNLDIKIVGLSPNARRPMEASESASIAVGNAGRPTRNLLF